MTSRLASLLVQDGLVSAKKMAEAFQRQVIYGGTLDTILLEMDVVDEQVLLEALARSSSLPIAGDLPTPEQLQGLKLRDWMPLPMSERHRAVPVELDGNVMRVLVIDPPDRKQLDELGYTLSLSIEPIIVPEYRFVQAVEMVYGTLIPARFASLAAKLLKRAADPTRARPAPKPAPVPVAVPVANTQPYPEPVPVAISEPAKAALIEAGKAVVDAKSAAIESAKSVESAKAVEVAQPVEAGKAVVDAAPIVEATRPEAVPAPSAEMASGPTARETPAAKADMVAEAPQTPPVAPAHEQRRVVTDVPMPGAKPAAAPNVEAAQQAELEQRTTT
ncbi:MAG TPA: hypothetical protein VHB97_18935, partial [Polyangia bacterium]|nr:hypothetical protein [Polyangia bacterium]